MKKLLVLLALCMVLSIVMVACEEPVTPPAETTQGTTTDAPTTDAPTSEEPTTEETTTDPGTTETDTTTPPETSTEETTTPPPPPADPVKVGMSFDQLYTGNGPATAGEENFFTPGSSASWDGKAVIEDYNVQYVTVWGWVAFFAETPGTFGYQIGDADPVFSADFYVEPEQPVIDAALGGGGKSAARMHISIPVEYVSGEEITVKALAQDAAGTIETLVEFKLTKPVNPNAPVAFIPAADMASSIPGSPDITDAVMSADGTYITVTPGTAGDPYYQLPMMNGKATVGAFVAIKYRSEATNAAKAEIFVGSGAGPSGSGDNIQFDLVCDGNWQLAVLDLTQATAVVDGVINYLRWDPYAGVAADAPIDLAYIAVFGNYEAAFLYDAQFAGVYRNVPLHDDLAFDLGVRTEGGPFVGGEKKFGQKLPLGETFLKNVTVSAMATYADGNENTWSFKVWQWAGDYATTVAGTPLFVTTGENHNDNSDFTVEIPAKLLISGDVYYEVEYLTGAKNFTPWTAESNLIEGVESYVDGNLKEGTYASSVVVGVEITEPELGSEENPVFVEFNWTDTGADATVTVPAGATVYYQGYFFGMILSINGENMGVQTSESPRMPIVFSITNDGEADAEYAIVISYPAGTMDNPEQLVIGENTAVIEAGNTQGYFFTYTAEADGTLTITVSCDAGWTYCINNLTTFVYGDIQWSDSDPVVNPAVIEVSAGDEIQIMVNTYDAADMWNIPAGTIIVTAAVDSAAAEAPEANEATISFENLTYRTEDGGEEYQVFSNNGFVYTQNQGTNTNGVKVDQYINPIRLYKNHVATFEFAGMTKLVVVFDTTDKNTAGFTDAIDALADANVTYSAEGDVVTVVFAAPVDSFNVVLANQVRVLSMTAISE